MLYYFTVKNESTNQKYSMNFVFSWVQMIIFFRTILKSYLVFYILQREYVPCLSQFGLLQWNTVVFMGWQHQNLLPVINKRFDMQVHGASRVRFWWEPFVGCRRLTSLCILTGRKVNYSLSSSYKSINHIHESSTFRPN